MINYKEQDRQAIIAYLTGKGEVKVTDIIAEAGANELRVYSLLQELYLEKQIEIVKTEWLGAPAVVRLK